MAARREDRDDANEGVPEGAAVFPLIPPELGVYPVLLALLHAVVFLDGSKEDIVHPDAAQEALEYMATYLQRLSGADLTRLHEDVDCLLGYAQHEGWDKQQVRFLKDLLTTFGIEEKRGQDL